MRLTSQILLISTVLAMTLAGSNGWAKDSRKDISKIGKRKVEHKTIISWGKEREIGKEYAAEIERRATLITDSQFNSYINSVTQTIVQNSDMKIPLVVKIIDSPEPNGSILPGGYIYLNSGFIRIMEGEGELAGALAFGVADVATRHWASTQTKASLLQYAMVPLISTPGTDGVYYQVKEAYMNGVPLAFLKFSRENVAESDYFAVQYLYKAGYDPNSYLALLGKLAKIEATQKQETSQAFSDRPPARVRIANCQKEISRILPPRAPSYPDNSDFAKMKALLETASKPSGTP